MQWTQVLVGSNPTPGTNTSSLGCNKKMNIIRSLYIIYFPSTFNSWRLWPCCFVPSHCRRSLSLWLSSSSGGDLSSTVRWFYFQNPALFIQLDDTVFLQVLGAIGWKQTLTSVGVPCVIWAAISNNPVWLIGFDFSPFLANNPLAGSFFVSFFRTGELWMTVKVVVTLNSLVVHLYRKWMDFCCLRCELRLELKWIRSEFWFSSGPATRLTGHVF